MPAFRYTFREKLPSSPSVIKAWFGKKYFIWKGKALHQFVEVMAKEIDRSLRLGVKKDEKGNVIDIYAGVIHHIKYARVTMMEIEVVCQTEDPLELLKCEFGVLRTGDHDPMCLNVVREQSYPKWIPQSVLDEYLQWCKKQLVAQQKVKRNRSAIEGHKTVGGKKGSSPAKSKKIEGLGKPRKASGKSVTSVDGLMKKKGTAKSAPLKAKAR